MKKSIVGPALALGLLLGTVGVALAAPGGGAQKIEWDGFVYDYQGIPGAVPVSCQTVITPSDRASQVCHAKGAANPTGKAVHYSGESTGTSCYPAHPMVGPSSQNWHLVITPSGNVTFVCHMP